MKYINTKVGIWDSRYELIQHRDGTCTVKVPFVKWRGESGTLDWMSQRFTDEALVQRIKAYFTRPWVQTDRLLVDILYGRL